MTTPHHSIKHGLSNHPFYSCWDNMMARCYRPTQPYYGDYGGRGIMVCEAWHSVATFIAWAESSGHQAGLTLDRADNNGPYSPENCQWSTPREQTVNRRRRRDAPTLTLEGITDTYIGWSRRLGGGRNLVAKRMRAGWPVKDAVTIPPGGKRDG